MKITLKAARVNKGLTQKEAAKLIGISLPSLAKYENGDRFPSIPTLKNMEAVYGVTYDDIIFLPDSTV